MGGIRENRSFMQIQVDGIFAVFQGIENNLEQVGMTAIKDDTFFKLVLAGIMNPENFIVEPGAFVFLLMQ